ncbi:MAG: M1 family metallopeptidase, partial [Anaerolineae bacterium]|nr:M1 family metallopeptidase [Anaerolineae bacterium]
YIPSIGNTGYDVLQYDLDIQFSGSIDAITATVTVSSVVTLDDLGRFSLDFTGYQVDSVQAGNQYVPFFRDAGKLYIDLPKALSKGEQLVTRVAYHGPAIPQDSQFINLGGLGFHVIEGNNLTYAFGEPDGAHAWFPCNDHPLDKAEYRFSLTVPKGFTAVANGTLLQTTSKDDRQVFNWLAKDPMVTYLATVVVGKYERLDKPAVGEVKIRHYVLEGDFNYSDKLNDTRDILEYYSDLIGPYPFSEFGFIIIRTSDDVAQFAEETQTIVMVDRGYMLSESAVGVLAHELAHHWFGDSVSLANWNEVWLKEGMATYLMVRWLDHQGYVGLQALMADLENVLVTNAANLNQPLNQPLPSTMYGPNTYDKGAWVYYMLSQQMGEPAFTTFLREYYKRFADGNASTVEVQELAEEVSGLDLSTFFQEWVYGSGNPDLHVSWSTLPEGVAVQVCQAGGGQVFSVPLEIKLAAADGTSQQEVIPLDEGQEQVTYSVPFTVTELQVDPDQKLLAGTTVSQVDALSACAP